MRLATLLLLSLLFLTPAHAQIYVANQGNFTDGNGSITFATFDGQNPREIFGDAGTIIQSIASDPVLGRAFVMASTAGAIDVIDTVLHERIARLPNVMNPRYLAFASNEKAFVTGQVYGDKSVVTVIDVIEPAILDTIQVPGLPDGIAVVGDTAYVALGTFGETPLVGFIHTPTNTLARTLDVGCRAPRYVLADEDEEVHILCSSGTDFATNETYPGAIVTLDAATGAITNQIEVDELGTGATGQDGAIGEGAAYVVSGSDILRFDTATHTITDTIETGITGVVGGVGVISHIGTYLYVAHYAAGPAGYTTNGEVAVFDLDGTLAGSFEVGIAPVHVALAESRTSPGVEDAVVPERVVLGAPYPNPFNPAATIPFEVRQPSRVTLTVYDGLGRPVATLADGVYTPGSYTVAVDGTGLASGVYVARLTAGAQHTTRRLVLVK